MLEQVIRVGLDEPFRYGANYIDLYPSNKEAAFPDREDYQHKLWPQYSLRDLRAFLGSPSDAVQLNSKL